MTLRAIPDVKGKMRAHAHNWWAATPIEQMPTYNMVSRVNSSVDVGDIVARVDLRFPSGSNIIINFEVLLVKRGHTRSPTSILKTWSCLRRVVSG